MITVIRVTCFSRNSFHPVLSLHLASTDLIVPMLITLATARPDRDEGEVGHQQNLWLEEKLKSEQCKKMTTRIIAMHHHLVGVPDTGTDKIVIVDAGNILRTCLHYDVNFSTLWT